MAFSIRGSATSSPLRAPRGLGARVAQRPRGIVGLGLTGLLVAGAILAPLLAPHDPLALAKGVELARPSAVFPFGTDELGRDLLSRVLYGGRVSLVVAFVSVLLASLVGVVVGLVGGYVGGAWDAVIMRIMDT